MEFSPSVPLVLCTCLGRTPSLLDIIDPPTARCLHGWTTNQPLVTHDLHGLGLDDGMINIVCILYETGSRTMFTKLDGTLAETSHVLVSLAKLNSVS